MNGLISKKCGSTEYFVRTNWETGTTEKDAKKAVRILMSEIPDTEYPKENSTPTAEIRCGMPLKEEC